MGRVKRQRPLTGRLSPAALERREARMYRRRTNRGTTIVEETAARNAEAQQRQQQATQFVPVNARNLKPHNLRIRMPHDLHRTDEAPPW